MLINISKRSFYPLQVDDCSSNYDESTKPQNMIFGSGYWSSERSYEYRNDYITFQLEEENYINYIELSPGPNGKKFFPKDFRIEFSIDGQKWFILTKEIDYQLDDDYYYIISPLIKTKFLRLFIGAHNINNNLYYSELGNIKTGIIGISNVEASSSISNKNLTEVLFTNNEISWESSLKPKTSIEYIEIDLEHPFNISQIALKSSNETKGFPEKFTIECSLDKKMWIPIVEEKNFKSKQGETYGWNTEACNAKYIRIEMNSVEISPKLFSCKITGIDIYATPLNLTHTHQYNDDINYSSIFQAGIVKLAKDGEVKKGVAIQADDRRLREGTTLFKGIVQFAENGEYKAGYAIQADDERITEATELKPGIVRLGYNGEKKSGVAVQSNDSRLDKSSENSFGVVKLCPDGLYSDLGVVKGSDSRLKESTIKKAGIVRLADNGEDAPNCAVQGNDKRLKIATTSAPGIVELSENGEVREGVAVQANDKRLQDATTTTKGIVELAENGEYKAGVVVQGNDKRLKDATTGSKGIVELAEDGEDRSGVVVQGNDKRLKNATDKIKGILRFAADGESAVNCAVQGNDKRLKDATTTSKGIIELAEDGEDAEGVVVQGNDKRLKDATTLTRGIVELAEDGEDAEGVAVQGNDKRLKDATVDNKGIVELAEDGENRENVVVQGNDRRLKDATTNSKGIIELAEDGEDKAGVVVQGNDKRLKDATENSKGILRFATDGEESEMTAVQGNDKRLRNATTTYKGIVELAEDGEDSPGVVVQANDKRLKNATEENAGIVIYAKNGDSKKNTVVQANDKRLSDARQPLPHEHPYAPLKHTYESHEGTIAIEGKANESFKGIIPNTKDSSLIYARNFSTKNGSIAISGIIQAENEDANNNGYGLLGHSPFVGIRGQSTGNSTPDKNKGCGVLGISRFGAGGVFSSEQDFSLIADGFGTIEGYDNSIKIVGNGKALKVNGESVFSGKIKLEHHKDKSENFTANIAELFLTDNEDYVSPGDLLVTSDKGNAILTKTRKEYNRSVIGVVTGNPVVEINNSGKEEKLYPIALSGKVLCKIDARKTPVKPGDLIVTSENPGCGMKGVIDSFDKVGTVIGKALAELNDGIDVIPIFLMPM